MSEPGKLEQQQNLLHLVPQISLHKQAHVEAAEKAEICYHDNHRLLEVDGE